MDYPTNRAARRRAASRRRNDQPITIIYSDYEKAEAAADAQADIAASGVPAGTPLNCNSTTWARRDAAWFAAHPGRLHHVRDPFPGESYGQRPTGPVLKVVIQQIRPGLRARAPFIIGEHDPGATKLARGLLAIAERNESVAATMFDMASAGRWVSLDEIKLMIERHEGALARVKS